MAADGTLIPNVNLYKNESKTKAIATQSLVMEQCAMHELYESSIKVHFTTPRPPCRLPIKNLDKGCVSELPSMSNCQNTVLPKLFGLLLLFENSQVFSHEPFFGSVEMCP